MTLPNICPCCGADIRMDEPIVIDDFSMFGDGYPLTYRERPLKLSPHESSLCWSLMKAYPMFVTKDALLLRMGSEDCLGNIVSVYIHRIRAKLGMMGVPDPIRTVHGRGFRWSSNQEMCE